MYLGYLNDEECVSLLQLDFQESWNPNCYSKSLWDVSAQNQAPGLGNCKRMKNLGPDSTRWFESHSSFQSSGALGDFLFLKTYALFSLLQISLLLTWNITVFLSHLSVLICFSSGASPSLAAVGEANLSFITCLENSRLLQTDAASCPVSSSFLCHFQNQQRESNRDNCV